MKYVIAILVCLTIIIVFHIIGVVAFGWKHGGGAIPQIILFAIVFYAFRAITKKKEN
jgi:uncharacterized RDD family membrane protein YckC